MRKLVITNGTGSAGKDTFCQMVKKELEEIGFETWRYSYVDFTRNMLQEFADIDTSKKTDKDRKLLAAINRALEEYDDIPFKDCCSLVEDFLLSYQKRFEPTTDTYVKNDADFIFLDVRVPEIIDRFKEKYTNVYTVIIDNGKLTDSTPEDLNVKNYVYDYTIDNTGTLCDLEQQAHDFVNFILNQEDTRRIKK